MDELIVAGAGRLVGIRHATAWDAAPDVANHRTNPPSGLMSDSQFRVGFAELSQRRLVFDAWLYHHQISELNALASAFPDVRIVLDHMGGPLCIGPYSGHHQDVLSESRRSLKTLAFCPNVVLKLGGIAMPMMAGNWLKASKPPSSAELAGYWAPHVRWCIETFGPDRCMFESNFPMDRVTCSYRVLWNAFKRIVSDASEAEKAALFRNTARQVYGLGESHLPAAARQPEGLGT